MNKFIGRSLGLFTSFSVFSMGLWAANNTDSAIIMILGIAAAMVGTGMIAAVSTVIGKDMDKRWN